MSDDKTLGYTPEATQSERACCGCIVGFVGFFVFVMFVGAFLGMIR